MASAVAQIEAHVVARLVVDDRIDDGDAAVDVDLGHVLLADAAHPLAVEIDILDERRVVLVIERRHVELEGRAAVVSALLIGQTRFDVPHQFFVARLSAGAALVHQFVEGFEALAVEVDQCHVQTIHRFLPILEILLIESTRAAQQVGLFLFATQHVGIQIYGIFI